MTVEERHLRIAGVLDQVPTACDFAAEAAESAGLDERAVYHCQLAVDEACTNVIEHGYSVDGEHQVIDIVCRRDREKFTISILDDSPPFDPLDTEDPDLTAPLEQREVGGWGVYFIKKLMDEVQYKHEDNRNRLMMVKRLPLPPPTLPENQEKEVFIPLNALTMNIWQITPRGRLDASLTGHLEQIMDRELRAGHRFLILDLHEIDYISSFGLKKLVGMWQRARELKGDVVLVGVHARVREVLAIIGLDLVFSIFDTTDSALADIRAR
jgi:anti-anti-sigma factor